jgi:hypothetical protein
LHYSLRSNPEERSSHLLCGGSLKTCKSDCNQNWVLQMSIARLTQRKEVGVMTGLCRFRSRIIISSFLSFLSSHCRKKHLDLKIEANVTHWLMFLWSSLRKDPCYLEVRCMTHEIHKTATSTLLNIQFVRLLIIIMCIYHRSSCTWLERLAHKK